jgi:hypothetical protein
VIYLVELISARLDSPETLEPHLQQSRSMDQLKAGDWSDVARSDPERGPVDDDPLSSLVDAQGEGVSGGFFSRISGRGELKAPGFFLAALAVRLVYLFLVVPVDWVGDSYHHWQVAWFTLNIGLGQGRLWDLKGVEYYWPPLPSLVEAFLMWLFRSPSIMLMRLANVVVGASSVAVSYLVGRRFDEWVGISTAAALVFFPLTLNCEVLALHEPMMVLLALVGVLMFLGERDFYSGLFLGLSYLCHFTVYLMAPILLLLYFRGRSLERGLAFSIGFGLVYAPYAFVLLSHTGDAFYNLRTMVTFMGISTVHMEHPLALVIGLGLLLLSLVPLGTLRGKASRGFHLVVALLSGYSAFWGVLLAFVGAPLRPYEMRYYSIFLVVVILALAIYLDTRTALRRSYSLAGIRVRGHTILLVSISSLMLLTMAPTFSGLQAPILERFRVADELGGLYEGGTIISPVPDMTYRLTDRWRIPPQMILGPIYCPVERGEKIDWLRENNVTLLFWLPGFEADRVFPELANGADVPPFYLVEQFSYDRYVYAVRFDESWNIS